MPYRFSDPCFSRFTPAKGIQYEIRFDRVCIGIDNYRMATLHGADPSTFREIGGSYVADQKAVYFEDALLDRWQEVPEADPKTFHVLPDGRGRDSRHIYDGLQILSSESNINKEESNTEIPNKSLKTESSQEEKNSIEKDIQISSDLSNISSFLPVPFIVQAPDGDWKNLRYQDGCEEASVLMAVRSFEGQRIITPKQELDDLSLRMEKILGTFYDTSMQDTFRFLATEIPAENLSLSTIESTQALRNILSDGKHLLLVATNGRKLGNPHYTSPGPEYHMLVVRGYDAETDQFITNDPGTRYGEGCRYSSEIFFEAMQDYATGVHGTRYPERKSVIAVKIS